MNKSTDDNTKTRKPRPKITGELIGVRLQPDLLAQLDAFIAQQAPPFPTRPEAIRRLVEQALEKQK